MELRNFKNREEMSRAVTDYTSSLIKKQTDAGKQFTLALSGGTSPVRFYELLAKESLDWSLVKLFLVDDRKVEQSHPDSNAKLIHSTLLSSIDFPKENIFFPDSSIESPLECARDYEARITSFFGDSPQVFDLIVLGVGPDGHTASLFPESENTSTSERLIVSTKAPVQFKVEDRISMTMALINKGANRIIVTSGEGKKDIIQRTMSADKSLPAGYIGDPCLIFSDTA